MRNHRRFYKETRRDELTQGPRRRYWNNIKMGLQEIRLRMHLAEDGSLCSITELSISTTGAGLSAVNSVRVEQEASEENKGGS
jgi:hypothetical protein